MFPNKLITLFEYQNPDDPGDPKNGTLYSRVAFGNMKIGAGGAWIPSVVYQAVIGGAIYTRPEEEFNARFKIYGSFSQP